MTEMRTELDHTLTREADHRARMALYSGIASLIVFPFVPFAIAALCLWRSTKGEASRGGARMAWLGRQCALVALVVLSTPVA